jgi:hypothetical protein
MIILYFKKFEEIQNPSSPTLALFPTLVHARAYSIIFLLTFIHSSLQLLRLEFHFEEIFGV